MQYMQYMQPPKIPCDIATVPRSFASGFLIKISQPPLSPYI